ncbi:MAG: hypothetical protein RLZZ387_1042 [Chloroflexota bacterium]
MDGLEQEYGARLSFERVDYNTQRGQALARRYNVRAHPTVLVVDTEGAAVATILGVPARERVAEAIRRVAR